MSSVLLNKQLKLLKNPTQFEIVKLRLNSTHSTYKELSDRAYKQCGVTCKIVPPKGKPASKKIFLITDEVERNDIYCKTCSFLYNTHEEVTQKCTHTDKQRGFWITRKSIHEINKLIDYGYKVVNLIPELYGLTDHFQHELVRFIHLSYMLYVDKIQITLRNDARYKVNLNEPFHKMKTKYGIIHTDIHDLFRRLSNITFELSELVELHTYSTYSDASFASNYNLDGKNIYLYFQITQISDDENETNTHQTHIHDALEYDIKIDEKWFLRIFMYVSNAIAESRSDYYYMKMKHEFLKNSIFNNYMTNLLKHPYELFEFNTDRLVNFKLTLHDYQVNNLGWMLNIENTIVKDTYNLITYRPDFEIVDGLNYSFFNDKIQKSRGSRMGIRRQVEHTQLQYPQYIKEKNIKYIERLNHIKGGLLADIMGAGKTVTCLSLVRYTLDNQSSMNRLNYYNPRKTPSWIADKAFIQSKLAYLELPDNAYKNYYELENMKTCEKSFVTHYELELLREKDEIKSYVFHGLNQTHLYKLRLIEHAMMMRSVYDNVLLHGSTGFSRQKRYTIPHFADIYRHFCIPIRATLIVCPSHMTKHWIEQSKKCSVQFKILHIISVLHMRKLTYFDITNADIVIISYNVLFNENIAKETNMMRGKDGSFANNLLSIIIRMKHLYEGQQLLHGEEHTQMIDTIWKKHKIDNGINVFGEKYNNSMIIPYVERDIINSDEVFNRMRNRKNNMPSIFHFIWRRVMFDEFHTDQKVNSACNSNYIKIYLHSKFRWIVSATPNITHSTGEINIKIFDTIKTLLDLNNVGDHILPTPDRCTFLNNTLTDLALKELEPRKMYNPTHEVMSVTSSSTSSRSSIYSEEISDKEQHDDAYEGKGIKIDDNFKRGILIPLIMFFKRASSPYGLIKSQLIKRNVYINQTDKERDLYTHALHGNNIDMLLQLCCHHNIFVKQKTHKDGEMKAMTIDDAIQMFTNGDIDKLTALYIEIRDLFTDIEQKQQLGQLQRPDFPTTKSIKHYSQYRETLRNNGMYSEQLGETIKSILNSLRKALTRGKKFTSIKESNEFNISVIELLKSDICKCNICEEDEIEINDMSVLKCGHAFCTECVDNMFSMRRKDNFPCPICRMNIVKSDVYNIKDAKKKREDEEKKEKQQEIEDELDKNSDDMKFIERYGSKMYIIINEYLKLLPTEKVIIYSMWGRFSKHLTNVLDLLEIQYRYAWGSVFQTQKAIQDFKDDPNVRIIIMSADGKNTGIELLCATHVFMVHPFPRKEGLEAEQQAISRTYRTGQMKDVTVTYFIMRNTIEEQLIESDSRHIPNVI